MNRRHLQDLSAAAQEYLLALRVMGSDGRVATTAQLGRQVGVSTQAASEMCRRLAADGLLRISVPDSRKALAKLGSGAKFADLNAAEVMPVAPLEHINSFDHASLVAMARRAGLRLVSPSLRALYDSSSGWFGSMRNTAKLAARPLYRHVYPKSTIAYFTLADRST